MGDMLFGSLMGELLSHLQIMVGLLESMLEGHHIYHVAGPGVDAHQLVGVPKWFVPGHTLLQGAVATKDEALSQTQNLLSHWQIDSQCWLEKIF